LLVTHDMKKLSRARWKPRRARRGFGLIEIVVTIAIIAMISGAVAVTVTKKATEAKISMTRTNARTIRAGIKAWWIDHDSSSCPDVKMLIDDGALERGKAVRADGWGEPWRILCESYDVTVSSKGPDKKPGTEDDIHEPSG
jgi:general secretion pathway protein G